MALDITSTICQSILLLAVIVNGRIVIQQLICILFCAHEQPEDEAEDESPEGD